MKEIHRVEGFALESDHNVFFVVLVLVGVVSSFEEKRVKIESLFCRFNTSFSYISTSGCYIKNYSAIICAHIKCLNVKSTYCNL